MRKILVFLAVWKRPKITEICFLGLNRLRKHPDYDINVLAVISEESMISLCEKYNVNWVMHENQPLGKKKNFGLKACEKYDFDFLMEIGSDDLILNELLDHYAKFCVKYDFFGVCDLAYINSETMDCRRLQGRDTFGAGRMISRKALEAMDFTLWKDKLTHGLDNHSIIGLYQKGFKYWQIPPTDYPLVIDIKSETNLWPFNYLNGVNYDVNEILSRISPEEVTCLEQVFTSASLIEG